jgi:hypothetical protein
MGKKRYIGIIICVLGVIVAAIGSLWESYWNKVTLIAISGPYSSKVGIAGLAILMVGVFLLTWPSTSY